MSGSPLRSPPDSVRSPLNTDIHSSCSLVHLKSSGMETLSTQGKENGHRQVRSPTMETSSTQEKVNGHRREESKDTWMLEEVGFGWVDYRGKPALKGSSGGWRATYSLYALITLEMFAYVGTAINMVPYLVGTMRFRTADAANTYTNFAGTSNMLCLLTAFIADTVLGRFWTIFVFCVVELMGLLLFSLNATIPGLVPEECPKGASNCAPITKTQLALLYLALYLMGVGAAGIRPNVPSHGADQFSEEDPKEKPNQSTFFIYYYGFVTTGIMLGVGGLSTVQASAGNKAEFTLAFGLVLMGFGCFISGSPFYRNKVPKGSPLTRIAEVFIAATRNFFRDFRNIKRQNFSILRKNSPRDERELYELTEKEAAAVGIKRLPHTNQLSFLDNAAIISTSNRGEPTDVELQEGRPQYTEHQRKRWQLCSVTQIEETKAMLKILPIWACTVLLNTSLAQLQTFSVAQSITMDRRLGPNYTLPAPVLLVFPCLFGIILVPIYHKMIIKVLRRWTGQPQGLTSLQRLGVSLFLASVSMSIAALVEIKRIHVVAKHGLQHDTSHSLPFSVFWLLPQHLIFAVADLFSLVGTLEFFYSQAPDSMRSMASALTYASIACGYFISTILVNIVNKVTRHNGKGWLTGGINDSKLYDFYWLLAVLSLINFLIYLKFATWYKYRIYLSPTTGLGDEEVHPKSQGDKIDDALRK